MITCHHCGEPITSRDTLTVVGRTLHPLHTECRQAFSADRPWFLRGDWPVNRWQSLAVFNLLLVGIIVVVDVALVPLEGEQRRHVMLLLLAANVWLLIARLVSYLSIERKLPATVQQQ